MLGQVAAKDSLLEDARLFEFAPVGPVEDEASEKRDEFSVFSQHRLRHGGLLSPSDMMHGGGPPVVVVNDV